MFILLLFFLDCFNLVSSSFSCSILCHGGPPVLKVYDDMNNCTLCNSTIVCPSGGRHFCSPSTAMVPWEGKYETNFDECDPSCCCLNLRSVIEINGINDTSYSFHYDGGFHGKCGSIEDEDFTVVKPNAEAVALPVNRFFLVMTSNNNLIIITGNDDTCIANAARQEGSKAGMIVGMIFLVIFIIVFIFVGFTLYRRSTYQQLR
eukprot:TRINITY_DN7288_c0_g1_i1.p1 TRINITY_DN7288_c0_g1~~TRINITY_DN7288_c0_g1_i1.p1  ORF type:complete len:204 (-),score=21.51 TRINITY_DN7288_c0_g1_i1:134-745(-)